MSSSTKNDIHLKRFKAVVFRFIGIFLFVASIVWGVSIWRFSTGAASADGVVIKLNAGGSHPQIQFTTADNKVIEYPQGGLISGYKIGDKVRVLYDKNNPSRAEIDSFGALWGFTVIFIFMSILFILAPSAAKKWPNVIE
jgi:Protein of unknown function (DUF3592)